MLMTQATALAASLLIAAAPSLPDCGTANANCPRVDFGTCGNACCSIDLALPSTVPESTAKALEQALRAGGPDGQFSLPPLEGGKTGFTDLRPYKVKADFIGQAVHTTAKRGYRDTVNIAIAPNKQGSTIRAFSVSNIGGALGDSGQNYRNIQLIKQAATGVGEAQQVQERIIFGCGD